MDYLMIVLGVALVLVLLALVWLLISVAQTIGEIRSVVDRNKRSIDIAILEASKNLEQTSNLLKTINIKEREIRETLDNIDTITTDVAHMTSSISNTLKKSEEVIKNSSDMMKNFNNISNIFHKEKKKGDLDDK